MYTEFGVNDTLSNKLWSKMLYKAMRENVDLWALVGKGNNSIIVLKDEISKGAGDRVTYGLRTIPQQDGITEAETAEGNGESLNRFSDNLFVNELLCNMASKSEDTIDAQRVPFNLREECKNAAADWWAKRFSVSFFNQVCGNSAVTNTKFSGMNATIPPGTGGVGAVRFLHAGVNTSDQQLNGDSSSQMSLDMIDQAVEAAVNGDSAVQPIMIDGQPRWVFYMHPAQATSLRKNTTAGQWKDLEKFAMTGGVVATNGIYTGALGVYNRCILRISQDIPLGVSSVDNITTQPNVRRAVLLGRSACCIAIGQKYGANKFRWNEELLDHKRKLEVSAMMIWGLKKAQFNSIDFGTIVVSTYAVPSSN